MIPRTNNGVAVKCHNLRKTYGEGRAAVQALRQVDLDVRTGELLMLVGPSGCGKTTLISIIAGILDQSEGDCLVGARISALFFRRTISSLRSPRPKTLPSPCCCMARSGFRLLSVRARSSNKRASMNG